MPVKQVTGTRSRLARFNRLGAGFLALALPAQLALAGSFSVDPVKVELTPARPAATLRVTNTQHSEITIQADTHAWSQHAGEDVLAPTSELLVVPPTFTLGPGEQQIVRVGLRRPAVPDRELAYRLSLREVPRPRERGAGLQMALHLNLPVFVQPSEPPEPRPVWRAERLADGRLSVFVSNQGSGHYRFSEWTLRHGESKAVMARDKKLVYILPGADRHWTLTPDRTLAVGDRLEILLTGYGRTVRVETRVQ